MLGAVFVAPPESVEGRAPLFAAEESLDFVVDDEVSEAEDFSDDDDDDDSEVEVFPDTDVSADRSADPWLTPLLARLSVL